MSKKKKPIKKRPPKRQQSIVPHEDILAHASSEMESQFRGAGRDVKIVSGSGAVESMSEALVALIEPYRHLEDSLDMVEKLCRIGMLAWNAAVMEPEAGAGLVAAMTIKLTGDDDEAAMVFMQMVGTLVARKMELFPDNQRLMMDCKVTVLPNDFHIAVASTLPPDMDPRKLERLTKQAGYR